MRVLITGSTGLLAKGFEETASGEHELHGVHRRNYRIEDARAQHHTVDVRDRDAIDSLFDQHKFDAVIHAAGMASVDAVEKDPEEGRASNVSGTANVARAAKRTGAYFVYISTNAVFDGTQPPYGEDDPTSPIHHYGRIKLECEKTALEEGGEVCIARPILMYGWNHTVNRPNPVSWIYEKLIKGENLSLVDDVYENPLFNLQCGRTLWAILNKRPSGIFHLAGATRINRYEMGLAIAKAFDLDPDLIESVDSSFFPSIAPRPKDTTFKTDRVRDELGVPPMTLEEGLGVMKETMGIGL